MDTCYRRILVRRALAGVVSQLEVNTSCNPLAELVVDVGTESITVSATALLPLTSIVGIADTEPSCGTVVTTRHSQRVACRECCRTLEQMVIVGECISLVSGKTCSSEEVEVVVGTVPCTGILSGNTASLIVVGTTAIVRMLLA